MASSIELAIDQPDGAERKIRRKGAVILLAALMLVAAITAAVVVFTDGDHKDYGHRGEQKATFHSADGRLEAAIYWYNSFNRFNGVTEVVLRPAGATAARDMVSFGCTEDEDGSTVVAVTVRPDSLVIRNSAGVERTIRFDPRSRQPESTLGSC